MNPRRSATVAAAFYPTVVIAGWAFVTLAGIGSPRIQNSAAAHVADRLAPSLTANAEATAAPQLTAPQTTAVVSAAPGDAEVATAAESLAPVTGATAAPEEPKPVVVAALTDPAEVL